MKWATAENLGTFRSPCIWLIGRFIDPAAEFLFFPRQTLLAAAEAAGARTFHAKDAGDYPTTATRSAFCVLMDRHELWGRDPALDVMGRLLDKTPEGAAPPPELAGIRALIHGFQDSIADDREKLVHLVPMYEALYRWCARRAEGRE